MAVKIGIIGNGWRTQTFLNIIRQAPEQFTLEGIFFRNPEKAAAEHRFPGKVFTDKEAFFAQSYDFVIVAVPRTVVLETCEEVYAHGFPVLCETPPAPNGVADLQKAWQLKEQYGAKVQVLEQYFCQPYHAALLKLVQEGALGPISNATMSMMHDYHGISMLRKLLNAGFADCEIDARCFTFPVVRTCGRDGIDQSGTVEANSWRKKATFSFANGTVGFYDFCDEQYFNYLRTRHAQVQGERGEITDFDVRTLDETGAPVISTITREDLGQFSNLEGYAYRGLRLNGRLLDENNLPLARLNDDELAIARIWLGMAEYAAGGTEIYPLAEALQDTYLFLLMDESMNTGKPIQTTRQPWHNEAR